MPANKSFPLVVDVWANPTHNRIPETERLFKQSHADPALFSKKLSPEQIIALMDEAGVSQICLSAWNTTGRKKVMFGTNFPQLTWKECVNNVHKGHGKNGKGGLKEEVLDDFIGGNAKRVLKLPGWNDKEAQSKL
ncbi:hypothetical protein BFJ68_g8756 [Fusarium oxysporum]|uniref:Amidohydrolase-related domain-containing protein n=1 Tax=Fusarium oxysporum TaxID=5507 RepID=A0A420QZJ4_FUSOX|nr:hypothetical protein BFJ68_g8756 [Fusarium oxysporum]